jgi:DNA-binding beta-propeller fold protein YncE
MEPAFPGQALKAGKPGALLGGRRNAVLLIFLGLALAACGPTGAPKLGRRWRIGLGACGLSADPSGKRLAVLCRRSNDVWVLSAADGALLERIDTLPKPKALLFHPDGLSFYVSEGLSSVAQVRLEDRRVARDFLPAEPVGSFAYDPEGGRLFCGHPGIPDVGVYRLKDFHLENDLGLGGEAAAVEFLGRDAWVATRQSDALVRIALTDMATKEIAEAGPSPRALALDGKGGWAYVACHGRPGDPSPLAQPSPAATPLTLAPLTPPDAAAAGLSPSADDDEGPDDGSELADADAAAFHLYDGSGVAVYRLQDVRRVDYLPVPGGPVAMVLAPSRRFLALACDDGNLRLLDLEGRRVAETLPLGGRPGAMIAAPDGKSLWVALSSDKALVEVLPGRGWR